jgi:hypothetical protein
MLYAKLAKADRNRIVCGACENGLVWISEAFAFGEMPPSEGPESRSICRYVLIPEGWFPDADEVWRPSQRAKRQLRRGLPVENRRRPQFDIKIWSERGGLKRAGGAGQYRKGFILTELPAEIVCIFCEMKQTLDGQMLKADPLLSSAERRASLRAEAVRMGSDPRRGYFPGAFFMPYWRIRHPKTGRWMAIADLSWGYLSHRAKVQSANSQRSDPVDDVQSAVAESE